MWLAFVMVLTAGAPDAAATSKVEDELKQITQEMLDAVAPGSWAVWDKYLDDAVIYTAEDGRTLTKAQLHEEFRALPPGYSGSIKMAEALLRVVGDTAVVSHEDLEHEEVFGQKLVVRYHTTDTWLRRDGRWRLIAAQVLVRLADPEPASVDPKIYDAYVGRYELTPSVTFTVTREGAALFGERSGRPRQSLLPEAEGVFFTPGAPRTRKLFVKDASGRVARMIDRRDGRDLVWLRVGDR